MTAADLTKFISFGTCRIREIHGFNNQSQDLYIQCFDQLPVSASVNVSASTVPTCKSMHTQAGNSFKWEFNDGLDFSKGLIIAVSSTETNYTAVSAASALDMTVVVDGPYLVANWAGLTVVGDLTTVISTLTVWSDTTTSAKRLLRLDTTGNGGTPRFLVGYAVDSPSASDNPVFFIPYPENSTLAFDSNLIPMSKTASTQGIHNGLTIALADTNAIGNISVSTCSIRAIYANVS